MRVNNILNYLLLSCMAFLLIGATDSKPRLTFEGLGPIRIGMTSDQVKAMGFRLTGGGPWDEEGDEYFISCHHLDSSPKFPGIALMMSDYRVVRIEISYDDDHGWQSLSGAKIGMPESKIAEIYGDWLKISSHPYLDSAGSYLSLASSDDKYSMIFETSVKDFSGEALEEKNQPKFVTHFRAGLSGPVGYIEGCA